MTLEKVIELAREQGYQVEYVKRKDGGLRVTKLNGQKFQQNSSAGNKAVRAATGAKLSVKQGKALKINRSKTLNKLVGSKTKKRIERLNKARKTAGLEAIPKKHVEAVKNRKGRGGVKQLIERGKRALRYKRGFAAAKNVVGFVSQLMDAADVPNANGETHDFGELIRLIQFNENYIAETSLQSGILIMYDWLEGKIEGDYAEQIMLVEFKAGILTLQELDKEIEDI